MADVFSKAKRSEVMARIRSRGNRDTELALARLLRANRITGWRRQRVIKLRSRRRKEADRGQGRSASSPWRLQVRPDFVFRQARMAIFVDGCFWHGCPRHCNLPASNRAFWKKKLAVNRARDRHVNLTLRKAGWRVVRLWEHDLATRGEGCIRRIKLALAEAG